MVRTVLTALVSGSMGAACFAAPFTADFSAPTYSDGSLDAQDGWVVSNPANAVVNAASGVSSVSGFTSAVNTNASAVVQGNDEFIVTGAFEWVFASDTGGSGPLVMTGLWNTAAAGDLETSGNRVAGNLFRIVPAATNPENYRIRVTSNWGNTYTGGFNQSSDVQEGTLGLDVEGLNGPVDLVSDLIEVESTFTSNADASQWTIDVVVTNLTTNAELIAFERTGIIFAGLGDTVYGGFAGGQGNGNQALATRDIDSFSFVVPEPGSMGLAALGILVLAGRRRSI